MISAYDVFQRLSVFGARIECRGERLVNCTGTLPVPPDLISAARSVKPALRAALFAAGEGVRPGKDAQQKDGEHLRCTESEKHRISDALVEDAQMSAFGECLGPKASKMLTEDDQLSTFEKNEDSCGSQPDPLSKTFTFSSLSIFGEGEHPHQKWGEAEEERSAIAEHDGASTRLGREDSRVYIPTAPQRSTIAAMAEVY